MAYSEALWQDAKKKCRLNNEDIKIAKELGLNPKSLIKNIPNKSEKWKAPVNVWIREIQEERKLKSLQKIKKNNNNGFSGIIDNTMETDRQSEASLKT